MTGDTTWQDTCRALRTGDAIRALLAEVRDSGVPLTPTAEAVTLGIARAELLGAFEAGYNRVVREIADEQCRLARLEELYDQVEGGDTRD